MHPVCFSKFKKYENILKKSEKIGHKHTQVTNTRKKIWQKITNFLLCAKKTNFWQKWDLKSMFFGQKFVFFAQCGKFVIFCRKFSWLFITCICLCPIFSRIFRSIFIFFKFRKAYRVHMHPGAKVDFCLMVSYIHWEV